MADDLSEIAGSFRAAAGHLRRLSRGPIRTQRDTTVAIEAYLYNKKMRLAPAFPPNQCQETANFLEELADKLEVLIRSSQYRP